MFGVSEGGLSKCGLLGQKKIAWESLLIGVRRVIGARPVAVQPQTCDHSG